MAVLLSFVCFFVCLLLFLTPTLSFSFFTKSFNETNTCWFFQLEHHLFPTMPRYKYPALVPVIKQFALDNGLPYKVDTDIGILRRTVNHLKAVATSPSDPAGAPSRSEEWVTPAALR
jgi:hypothetical protein